MTFYPLYETIPDLQQLPVHVEEQTEENYERVKIYEISQNYERAQTYEKPQTYERAQIYERAQTYERINHCDVQFDVKHNEPQRDDLSDTTVD